jgi:hypothetical protein
VLAAAPTLEIMIDVMIADAGRWVGDNIHTRFCGFRMVSTFGTHVAQNVEPRRDRS